MEKYRIAFTVRDYYDYIGTNPYYSIKKRMLESIPDLFKKNGYNIKFKCIYNKLCPWNKYYRVRMSVRMTEEEIQKIFNWNNGASFHLYDVSYKLITKHF